MLPCGGGTCLCCSCAHCPNCTTRRRRARSSCRARSGRAEAARSRPWSPSPRRSMSGTTRAAYTRQARPRCRSRRQTRPGQRAGSCRHGRRKAGRQSLPGTHPDLPHRRRTPSNRRCSD
eukprot:2026196-Pleurochrysis_carterae.AAC.2